MKKFFSYFKQHPVLALLYVLSVVMLFIDNECGMTMMATAAVAVTDGTVGKPTATAGQTGEVESIVGGATTVSNVSEASDIIEPDVDEDIVQIASDESVIDTIKRKVKRKVRVTSFEVDHYLIDEKPAVVNVKSANVTAGSTSAVLKFEEGADLMEPYYTAVVLGVKAYTGATEDLVVMCIEKDTDGNPKVKAVNGQKTNSSDAFGKLPAITGDKQIVLCAPAAYETQKFIAPSTVVPAPERMYLQKQLCNRIVSDYFEAQKKKVPFKDAVIAEAILRQFRLECCRTAWIGAKGKVKVKALDASLGDQWAYTSQGLRWQFKREEDLAIDANGKASFDSLIDIAKEKFTKFASSKTATFVLGKDLLGAIQKTDMTLHKDITMSEGTTWGVKCTKLVTVFGTINLVHDPTLDRIGCSWEGGLIDEEGLVRYYMKNEDVKTESVEGEEAKRQIVMTIDCLCLKGYSHMWVKGVKNS
jgi:hypothetical protein